MAGLEGLLFEDSGRRFERRDPETYMMMAGATLRETLVSNPVAALYRAGELSAAGIDRERLSAADARARIKAEGFEGALLVPDSGISRAALDILIERKHDERLRQEIMANSPTGAGATTLKLAMGLAGSLVDPINVASGFVPVVGEARYAKLLGKSAGVLRRTAVRAGVGAVEGTAGAAIVEPIIAGSKSYEQADYTMADSLLNIGFGTVFGGGLHVIGGSLGDAWRYARGSAGEVAERVAPETRAAGLRAAIAQAASGERVNVEPLMRMDPAARISESALRDENLRIATGEHKVKSADELEHGSAYHVAEGELTDEQLAQFQGLRSHVPGDEDVRGSAEGASGESRHPDDGAARGEPLKVYRGSSRELTRDDFADEALGHATGHPSSGLGVFFTNQEDRAAQYGQVSEHHLDIRNPKVVPVEDLPGFDSLEAAAAYRRELEAQGHDGLVIDASHLGGSVDYVAFKPEQVLRARGAAPRLADLASLDDVRRAAEAPKLSTIADEDASASGVETLEESAEYTRREELPAEEDIAVIDQETADILASLKSEGIEADLTAADELVADAETYSRAARAAVMCGLKHA